MNVDRGKSGSPRSHPRRVDITYHAERGGWWAECGDMPGWSAAGASSDEVRRLAREAVEDVFGGRAVTVVAFIFGPIHQPGLRFVPAGRETLEVRS